MLHVIDCLNKTRYLPVSKHCEIAWHCNIPKHCCVCSSMLWDSHYNESRTIGHSNCCI